MTIDELFNYVSLLYYQQRKVRLVPERFNEVCGAVMYERINSLYGDYNEYKSTGRQLFGYPFNKTIMDAMQYFKATATFNIQNGLADIPLDYMHSDVLYCKIYNNDTQVTDIRTIVDLTQGKFQIRKGSQMIPPTLGYPICCFYSTYIEFAPSTMRVAYMDYLRKPNAPVWGYTKGDNEGKLVYDESSSTQIELPEWMHPEFAVGVVEKLSLTKQVQN